MGNENKISITVIRRLPRYYRYLTTLNQMGINRVSSNDLSKIMGITSSQIRQDFFSFGGTGLQGYGYDVELLQKEIGNILGLEIVFNMVIIGAGNLGRALAKYVSFEKKGFKTVGIFDVNTQFVGEKIGEKTIMHFNNLDEFVKTTPVDIAIITVPREYAREAADKAIKLGVKGIWNFAPLELDVPEDVSIENIHLSDSLMVLGYGMKEKRRKK